MYIYIHIYYFVHNRCIIVRIVYIKQERAIILLQQSFFYHGIMYRYYHYYHCNDHG